MSDDQFVSSIDQILRITGWSQAELARQLGLDPATITNWRKKKRSPDGTARYAITDVLRRAKAGDFKQPAVAAAS